MTYHDDRNPPRRPLNERSEPPLNERNERGSSAGMIVAAIVGLLIVGGLIVWATSSNTPQTAGTPPATTGSTPATTPAPKAPADTPATPSPDQPKR